MIVERGRAEMVMVSWSHERTARLTLATLAMAFMGCDSLTVRNVTEPDAEGVYGTASSIEQTIATQFRNCHNARTQVWSQATNLSLDGFNTLSVGQDLPRASLPNAPGSQVTFFGDYSGFGTNSRTAANLLTALDRLLTRGGTLGSKAQNLRARAFGFFSLACHLGHLALVYDSAAIVTPGLGSDSIPPFSGAAEVMRVAIEMLDTSIAVASNPAASDNGGFPLPAGWINGNALSRDDFVRLVRSLRGRFRAGVARTPDERERVNWDAVIDDARNGVSGDLMITTGTSTGWSRLGGNTNQPLPPMYYGMADVSGAYDAWLALPPSLRGVFLIQTPDRRFPQGATRQAQQASGSSAGASFVATPYLINRTDEVTGQPWLVSHYLYRRVRYLTTAATVGPFPFVTRAEMDLLAAEGHLRRGDIAAAAALIDVSRVGRGQLPALKGVITNLDQPVPGGANCVPRVPTASAFTSTACGNIWEAMKWEKRMETAIVNYAGWYVDGRGWGDLIEGTALEFPVPYEELAARHKPYYTYGGGLRSSAARGTYGF